MNIDDSIKNRETIILSLTSTPNRIYHAEKTIKSLLNQTYKNIFIVFNIPYYSTKGEEYKIPDWLLNYEQNYPNIKLNRCEKDFGPATKLIPTLEIFKDNPDQKIIFLDDDMIYPKNLVKILNKYSKVYKDSVVTGDGKTMKDYLKPKNPTIIDWILVILISIFSICMLFKLLIQKKYYLVSAILVLLSSFVFLYWSTYNKKVDVVFGYTGVLVKPKFFDYSKISDIKKYPKAVYFNDDVLFSGHLKENGINCYRVFTGYALPHFHRDFFNTLSFTINSDGQTTKEAFSYFKWE